MVHTALRPVPANGSELVLFDVNHVSGIAVFMQAADRSLVQSLLERAPRRYRRVLVTNRSAATREVEARAAEPGSITVSSQALGLAWPPEVFSLSHVALPFAPTDPLYGIEASGALPGLLPIGRLSPRGERAVLTVATDTLCAFRQTRSHRHRGADRSVAQPGSGEPHRLTGSHSKTADFLAAVQARRPLLPAKRRAGAPC